MIRILLLLRGLVPCLLPPGCVVVCTDRRTDIQGTSRRHPYIRTPSVTKVIHILGGMRAAITTTVITALALGGTCAAGKHAPAGPPKVINTTIANTTTTPITTNTTSVMANTTTTAAAAANSTTTTTANNNNNNLRGSSSPPSCALYTTQATNCVDSKCSSCFNGGGRPGVKCEAGGVGYYCAADATPGATFACMDWSFASSAMRGAEAAFTKRTGERVYLGVGTYGVSGDPQRGLGNCYRMTVEGVDRDIIAQSINTGTDVAGNQFDLQMGAGGAGMYDVCAGAAASMYEGGTGPWGCVYGGVDNATACHSLPEYPRVNPAAMKEAGDSLVGLCVASFEANVRMSGEGRPAGICKYNPTLLDVARVQCPEELTSLTWFQRSDDPSGYKFTDSNRPEGFPNLGADGKTPKQQCETFVPNGSTGYCLTRMMDCRKPSGGFTDNVRKELMVPGRRVVQTCTADGYTRIDVQCGCNDCYC